MPQIVEPWATWQPSRDLRSLRRAPGGWAAFNAPDSPALAARGTLQAPASPPPSFAQHACAGILALSGSVFVSRISRRAWRPLLCRTRSPPPPAVLPHHARAMKKARPPRRPRRHPCCGWKGAAPCCPRASRHRPDGRCAGVGVPWGHFCLGPKGLPAIHG